MSGFDSKNIGAPKGTNGGTAGTNIPDAPKSAPIDQPSISSESGTEKKDEKKGEKKNGSVTTDNDTSGGSSKMSAKDKLAARSKASGGNRITSAMERMSLFDSTKAGEVQTKGTSNLPSVSLDESAIMIKGRNVGAEQNEPDWSPEQMQVIRTMCEFQLPINTVNGTRRSVMDPAQEYVGRDDGGSIVPMEKAYATNIDPTEYCIGTGPEKFDTTGSPKYYTDTVMAGIKGDWLLSQWTSEWIVIEGVSRDVLMRQHRTGSATQSNRKIGINFARIGLPKMAFGPLFNTLEKNFPGSTSSITQTDGYYWMNASWGVSSFNATFAYMDDNTVQRTSSLADVMTMLNGRSALSLATVAISLTCPAKQSGDSGLSPDTSSYGLSVKLHNAFCVQIVDYHGPPQQGSTGMMIPKRIREGAVSMSRPAGVTKVMGGASSIFNSSKPGLMGAAAGPAPSIKSNDNASFM